MILLVDDEADILMLLSRFVRQVAPHAAVVCVTGGEAALAQAQLQQFALAIVDFNMPGINGICVAELLLKSQQARSVMIVSAYHTPELERSALIAGASYLSKPLDLDRFESMVRTALTRT